MSGYIQDLRQIVGHRTLIQCAASIICVNDKGQLLLGNARTITSGDTPAVLWRSMSAWKTARGASCMRKCGSMRGNWSSSRSIPARKRIISIQTGTKFPTLRSFIYAGITAENLFPRRKNWKRSATFLLRRSGSKRSLRRSGRCSGDTWNWQREIEDKQVGDKEPSPVSTLSPTVPAIDFYTQYG